ncbi:hypothetical protein ABZ619_34585 [Streptomyces sp. NPDC007851]|uniref:hypothetical protein n=1 Tax=Streptomyces sp. NPDC007851 TaxID=3155008 RepID=UPI0033D93633
MLDTARDLLAVEITELKDEVLGDGRAAQGVTVEVHSRVRTVGALTEDGYEQGEVFRTQQEISVVHHARDTGSARRDLAAEVVQAVDQGIPECCRRTSAAPSDTHTTQGSEVPVRSNVVIPGSPYEFAAAQEGQAGAPCRRS